MMMKCEPKIMEENRSILNEEQENRYADEVKKLKLLVQQRDN